jgi:hypothetical protein
MMYTKELIFDEFKEVTKKDLKKKKCFKEDMIKVPRNFSNISIKPEQLQNLIDCWSAPNPRDSFYMKVFNMTYAEKKQEEEAEYFDLDNGKKVYMKKKPEVTDTIQ